MPNLIALAALHARLLPVALCLGLVACNDAPSPTVTAAPPRPETLDSRLARGTVAITARVGDDSVRSSGVLIDAGRGLVLTSAHSVWGARSLKLHTALGTTHGRVVARSACDDLALVAAQPRLPGLTAVTLRASGEAGSGDAARILTWRGDRLVSEPAPLTGRARDVVLDPRLPTLRLALRHEAALPPESTGAALVDAGGQVVGLALQTGEGTTGLAVPVDRIRERLDELRPGPTTTFVGWEAQYRCAPRLHEFAGAAHVGFLPRHARLNAPLAATRVPGVRAVD